MEQSMASPVITHEKAAVAQLDISSTAFVNKGSIPKKYTYNGENINPPLKIENLPQDTKSLVLIVDGSDTAARLWTHWIVWNIPPTHHIKEDSVPGTEGLNDFWEHNYEGPSAPKGMHHYFFRVYALNLMLRLPAHSTQIELEAAMKEHILACGQLMGVYDWHSND